MALIMKPPHLFVPRKCLCQPFVDVGTTGPTGRLCRHVIKVVNDQGICPVWNPDHACGLGECWL